MVQLYAHQRDALQHIQQSSRGIFNVICGGGKSLIMIHAIRNYQYSAIFAPTKILVEQISELVRQDDATVTVVAINSDNYIPDLDWDARVVFVVNYQSNHVFLEMLNSNNIVLDIVFCDEAHNASSRKRVQYFGTSEGESDCDDWTDDSSDDASDVVDDSLENDSVDDDFDIPDDADQLVGPADFYTSIPCRKLFFMTATPNQQMRDRPEVFGEILLSYTFPEAVRDKVIKNFDTVIHMYQPSVLPENFNPYVAMIRSINALVEERDLKRMIIYVARVNKTDKTMNMATIREFADTFNDSYRIDYIDANTSASNRSTLFQNFQNEEDDRPHIIVSCRTISEGLDLKNCDSVVILDYSKSIVLNVQRALRCCRLTDSERTSGIYSNATVFYPINISQRDFIAFERADDKNAFLNQQISRDPYEYPMTILQFLKSELGVEPLYHYAPIAARGIDTVSTSNINTNGVSSRLTNDSPSNHVSMNVTFQLHDDFDLAWGHDDNFQSHMSHLAVSLSIISVAYSEERAMDTATQVLSFFHTYGTWPRNAPTDPRVPNEKYMGTWLHGQRSTVNGKKGDKVYDSVYELLHPLGAFELQEKRAIDRANQVATFFNTHGAWPRQTPKDPKEVNEPYLGRWLNGQRCTINDKKSSKVVYTSVRDILQPLGAFEMQDLEQDAIGKAEQIKAFFHAHGTWPRGRPNKPGPKEPNEKFLGTWLHQLKATINGKKGAKLYTSVRDILQPLGAFEMQYSERRAVETANKVASFFRAHGAWPRSGDPKDLKEPNEKFLGSWLITQRYTINNDSNDRRKTYVSIREILGPLGAFGPVIRDKRTKTPPSTPSTQQPVPVSSTPSPTRYSLPPLEAPVQQVQERLPIGYRLVPIKSSQGYTAPNPGAKSDINTAFAQTLPAPAPTPSPTSSHPHLILLDDHEFKTTNAIFKHTKAFTSSQIRIPQFDKPTYDKMQDDEKLAECVTFTTLQDMLAQYEQSQHPLAGIYADLMGHSADSELQQIAQCNLVPGAIVAFTVCNNRFEASEFTNAFATRAVAIFADIFQDRYRFENPRETPLPTWVYGNGEQMVTVMYRVFPKTAKRGRADENGVSGAKRVR